MSGQRFCRPRFRRGASPPCLIDRDIVYINTGYEPFEIRGRDAYLAFGASLHDLYTAPRSQEILGIDAFTPSMACIRVRVTVGDVSSPRSP